MAITTESKKMITLRSSDGEVLEIEESVGKHMIADDCAESVIPLPNVNSKAGTSYLHHKEEEIKYGDFVNKLYSRADLQWSIPSMVDGLKPAQRKILFCAFKRNLIDEATVTQFSNYVSEHSAYYHFCDQSLSSTIVEMAQDFVGSNNINLFQPRGLFGTRRKGGKDAASVWHLYTCLSPIARFLFPKDDDLLLDYLEKDGESIEPAWYVPVIPMVLVNGSEGIGTGCSSSVPSYNPRDVVANLRRLLNDEPMQPMKPWYRGFKGLIEKSAEKETGVTYTTSGIIEEVGGRILRITELPIRSWTEDYDDFLDAMVAADFIQMKRRYTAGVNVRFEFVLSVGGIAAIREGLESSEPFPCPDHLKKKIGWLKKKLKLTNTIKTSNMYLFDSKGAIKKYDTPEQILEDFFHLRLQFYEKRKKAFLDNILELDNKIKFILGVVSGAIKINKPDLFLELYQKKFTPFPKKTNGIDAVIEESTVDTDENEEGSSETVKGSVKASDYEYLLSMSLRTFTPEKVKELYADKQKLEYKVEELRSTSSKTLWMGELDALEKQLDELDRKDAEASMEQEEIRRRNMGAAIPTKAPKKPRKKKDPAATAMDTGNVPEMGKPKPRGGRKKAPAKSTVVESNDDEVLEQTDRLAAYNLDSSWDQAFVETESIAQEVLKKKAPNKRAAARKGTTLMISDDIDDMNEEEMSTIIEDGDDRDFHMVEAPKGKKAGAGRKPANAKSRATATTNITKRGGAQRKKLPEAKFHH